MLKKTFGKKIAFTLLSSTLLLSQTSFSEVSAQPKEGGKRALLIGVWKYNHGPGYPNDLHTEPDVAAMKTILLEEFKVPAANITTMTAPDDTTKAAIQKAFAKLVSDTKAGDQVYFHYSGHGSQVPDQDGDENIDGMDETIVPSDYDPKDEKTRADSQIRDDDVHKFIDQLLAKTPELVTMVFDCCNSGTVSRDVRLPHRGFQWEGATPSRSLNSKGVDKSGFADKQVEKNLVVISAARPDQEAQETLSDQNIPMGLLTYSLGSALAKDRMTPTTTYRDLFEDVTVTIAAKKNSAKAQNPQIEGKLDNVLMSGKVIKPDSFLAISRGPKGQVILGAGDLHNVTKDSVYELFPAGTKKAAEGKSLGKFKVKSTMFTRAVLEPVEGTPDLPSDVKAARATEIDHAFGALQLNVVLENLGETGKKLSPLLEKNGKGFFVPFSKAKATDKDIWDVKLKYKDNTLPKDGEIVLLRADGSELFKTKIDPANPDNQRLASDLSSRLREELRWTYLKKLGNLSGSNVAVEIRAIPVVPIFNDAGEATGHTDKKLESDSGSSRVLELKSKDYFMIDVRIPEGKRDAYVTVLNLTADGQINQSFPEEGVKVDGNKLTAGEWHRLEAIYENKEPFGDIMKAVATIEPTDFTPLLTRGTRGSKGTTPKNPIAQLFLAADDQAELSTTTRSVPIKAAPTGWGTSQVDIVVTDAKSAAKEGSIEASN